MNIQSGATRQGLNYGQIRSLQIPMCDLDKQKEIAQKIEIVNTSVRALEKSINQQLSKSNSLVQALLKKAFDGKLVERDVDDEPVGLLLERLRSQKETYISNEKRRSKERINYIKELTMSEKLRTIVEILNESDEPVSAKKLWESSVHKDDIDAFYAQLKIHIEEGEIQEMPRENKLILMKKR
jgi:type I restriction enzyme S subunit